MILGDDPSMARDVLFHGIVPTKGDRIMKKAFVSRPLHGLVAAAVVGILTACHSSGSESAKTESRTSSNVVVSAVHDEPIKAQVSEVSTRTTKPEKALPVEVALGLEHDTPQVDYLDQAHRKIDEDDLVGAFLAFRRHLYDQPETVDVLLELADVSRRLGEVEIAETALLHAEKREPNSVVATELARLYLEGGKLDAAREAAERAVQRDKTDPVAFNQLGRIAMAESEWQRAELAFRHALELDPTEAFVHNNIGLLYVRMKKGPEAVDALETAVELFGETTPHFVYNNLGLAHEMNGNLTSAREAFEDALLAEPFYARAKVNLERVERTLAQREAEDSVRTAQLNVGSKIADAEAEAEEVWTGTSEIRDDADDAERSLMSDSPWALDADDADRLDEGR